MSMSSVKLKDTARDSDKAMSSAWVTTSRPCRLSLLTEAAAEVASLLEWVSLCVPLLELVSWYVPLLEFVSWCAPLLEGWELPPPKAENKSNAASELVVGVASGPVCVGSSIGRYE